MLPSDPSPSAAPPPRRVPEPFLRAEVSAFPLGSEESFRACLIALDPQLGSKTGLLWRACEDHLAPHTGWSLDRLVAARDRGWFGPDLRGGGQPVAMLAYLRALARSHLIPRAGVTGIEESTDLSALDAADHYRWLTLTLPEDLLLGALGVEPAPMRVDVDPPLLARRLLDLGVAEIHQHVGGSMDFPLLWASALAAIVSADVPENALDSPGAPLSGGQQLVRWLLVAGIARCVLAEHLIRKGDDLRAFVYDTFLDPKSNSACIVWTPRRRATLAAVFDALASADDKHLPAIEALRDLYCDMHPTALTFVDAPLTSVDDAYERCDPIAVRLGLHGRNAGERWLLRHAFTYLDVDARPSGCVYGEAQQQVDGYFSLIFWQVVRIRCQYYRTVVQRPLTGGLQWFIRFYERIGKLIKPLDPILAQVSFKVAGGGHRIRALEMRTTLDDTPIAVGEWVLSFLQSWRRVLAETSGAMFEPEMGLIFHFVKTRDANRNWSNGVPKAFWSETLSEPVKQCEVDVARGRFVDYFDQQCRKTRALSELIKAVPSCLWVIRGLDVATDELGVPTWVMAPLFRHLVDTSARASGLEQGLAPLRVTAHAGEDFRHLLEGMRRIYEQVYYVLGSGRGRLGHAIALGVEPRSWAESVGSVLMPAEERLWDLVWEWRLYARYRIQAEFIASAPAGRGEVLLNKVRELSDWIYGKRGYRIEELAEAHHVLHRFLVPPYSSIPAIDGGHDVFLRAARSIKWGSYQGRVHFPRRVGQILEAYLEDEATFIRGQRLIDVPVRADEVQALDAVQHALRRGVAQRGIVIEVNPSSNLLIGDLLDLRNHPILRLNPPLPEPGAPPPVAIALGSDDPLTFSTELLREYTLLHQAACAAGYPERVVHEWLESIRRTGMDARFTLAWQPSAKKKVDILIDTMGRYLHQRGQC